MKKIIILLLMVLLLVGTVFAGGSEEAKSNEKVTLEWWTWDPTMKDKNQEIIASYQKLHPNVEIVNTIISTKEYWTKIRIQAQQQKLPDVFTMSSGSLEEWSENGLMLELDKYIAADDTKTIFFDSLLESAKNLSGTDHYYALPFALVTTPLYFNKDAFDAAGVEYPTQDWTWEDFKHAAKKLTVDKDNDGRIDQYGFWFYGRYAQVESWVYANDGKLIDKKNMKFAPDANALEALHMLTDLVLVDGSAPSQKEMSAMRQQDIFPRGMAAMWVDGSWNISNNRKVADSSLNWGITRVPKGPSASVGYTYAWPDSYSIAPNTKHPQEAWDFTRYVAGQGLSLDMYMAGKIPSYKALTESEAFLDKGNKPAEMDVLIKQAGSPQRTSFTKGWKEWRGYAAANSLGLNGAIDGIINGEMTFDEGMDKATKAINGVFERYYN